MVFSMKYIKMLKRDGVVFDNIFELKRSICGTKIWYIVIYTTGKILSTYTHISNDDNCDLLVVDTEMHEEFWVSLKYANLNDFFGYLCVPYDDYITLYFYNGFLDFLDLYVGFDKALNFDVNFYRNLGILCREFNSVNYTIHNSTVVLKACYGEPIEIKACKDLSYFKMRFAKMKFMGKFEL